MECRRFLPILSLHKKLRHPYAAVRIFRNKNSLFISKSSLCLCNKPLQSNTWHDKQVFWLMSFDFSATVSAFPIYSVAIWYDLTFTAAVPYRICTCFPFHPLPCLCNRGHLLCVFYFPVYRNRLDGFLSIVWSLCLIWFSKEVVIEFSLDKIQGGYSLWTFRMIRSYFLALWI